MHPITNKNFLDKQRCENLYDVCTKQSVSAWESDLWKQNCHNSKIVRFWEGYLFCYTVTISNIGNCSFETLYAYHKFLSTVYVIIWISILFNNIKEHKNMYVHLLSMLMDIYVGSVKSLPLIDWLLLEEQ